MIIDKLDKFQIYSGLSDGINKALNFLANTDFQNLSVGVHEIDGDMYFIVNEYKTKEDNTKVLEAHRRYIDIQYILSGSENIRFETYNSQKIKKEYDLENDYLLYEERDSMALSMKEGMFAIFFPEDLHWPGLINTNIEKVRKVVVKILIDKK